MIRKIIPRYAVNKTRVLSRTFRKLSHCLQKQAYFTVRSWLRQHRCSMPRWCVVSRAADQAQLVRAGVRIFFSQKNVIMDSGRPTMVSNSGQTYY